MRKAKGGITVFAALSFMLVAQLLFVLAEGCRQVEMVKVAQMNSDSVMESLMAEYCSPMWDNYHLLANNVGGMGTMVNTPYMEGFVMRLSEEDFAVDGGLLGLRHSNLLRLQMTDVEFDSYTLLTDRNGAAYVKLVAEYMKDNILYESAKRIYNNYEAMENVENNSKFSIRSLIDAISAIGGGSKTKTAPPPSSSSSTYSGPEVEVSLEPEEPTVSPEDKKKAEDGKRMLEDVRDINRRDLLDVVLPQGKGVSRSTFDNSNAVSRRSLARGKNPETESSSWLDKIFLQQYILTYFFSYSQKAEGGNHSLKSPLSYEVEYIIGGKSSDRDNLKAVATRLMAVREAANMLYLYNDAAKKAEAKTLATAISAGFLLPQIEPLVEVGIIAAWAYCESILDVRALFNGKKIALLKTADTWTSGLTNISQLLSQRAESVNCSTGLDYQDYTGMLLLGKSTEKMAKMAMDLEEAAIQRASGYSGFRMDHCICSAAFTAEYAYTPLFFSLVYLISADSGQVTLKNSASYSYLKKKGS